MMPSSIFTAVGSAASALTSMCCVRMLDTCTGVGGAQMPLWGNVE